MSLQKAFFFQKNISFFFYMKIILYVPFKSIDLDFKLMRSYLSISK